MVSTHAANRKRITTRTMATCSILTAIAIVLHIVEALLPNPFPIPGVKLGLANIVTLWAIYSLGFGPAMTITLLRTILASLLIGTFLSFGFFMSLAGGIVSTVVMYLAKKLLPKASIMGISVIGAVFHNITQLTVASLVLEQTAIFFYLPILLFSALPAGIITAFLVKMLLKRQLIKG